MLVFFILLYIIATLAIGFWASKRIKTASDFMIAGRNLSTAFVGVTMFATWFGSRQVMGNPGHFAEEGLIALVTLILPGIFCLLIVATFYARRLYRMNIVTVGDFFRIRFTRKMDTVVSIITVFSFPPWIAAQFVALAFLFQGVFGLPVQYGILVGAAIVVIYTYIGGMWAVSYTDMLQSLLILVGLVFLLISVLSQTGGISPLFADKPDSFYKLLPESSLEAWSAYMAVILAFLIGAIPVQEIYQRVFSARTEDAAVKGLYLAALIGGIMPLLPMLIALGGAHLHPELMATEHGQNLIPEMVSSYASLPIQILFYGALISAILSTCSGAMLAPATVIADNLLKPNMPNLSDKRLLLWTRISVILVAIISCLFAYNDSDIVGLVVATLSLVLVCIFAPFTFGLFWSKSSVFGAWTAIIAGGLTWLSCYLSGTVIDPTIYGTAVSCLGMILGSLLRPDSTTATNSNQSL